MAAQRDRELAEAVDALLAEYDRTMAEDYEKPGVVFFDRLRAARADLEEEATLPDAERELERCREAYKAMLKRGDHLCFELDEAEAALGQIADHAAWHRASENFCPLCIEVARAALEPRRRGA